MRVSGKIINHVLLLVFLFTGSSTAEIISLKIKSDDRPMILFQNFGFTDTGRISVAISSVSVSSTLSQTDPDPDPFRLGFFLISQESLTQVLFELQQDPNLCVLFSKFIHLLFTFRDLPPPPPQSSFNRSYPVTYPGEYSLLLANCNPASAVTMDVRTELYNTVNGTNKNYLSIGLTQLPSLYFIFSLIYLCFLGLWIFICFKNQRSFFRVHLLMVGLLATKTLNLISAAEDKHYVNVTGTPHGWNVLFYIFQFIGNLLLFTVIVLIGTGSSFLKPYMQEKKKKVLIIVIPLQVLANVVSIVIMETGPFIENWVTFNQVFLLVDVICCCAIIFPVVTSIRTLRETSKIDGKAARNLAKLIVFRRLVVGYLFFTRIVIFAVKIIVGYKYQWVSNATEEVASFVFYVSMFYMFRPIQKN